MTECDLPLDYNLVVQREFLFCGYYENKPCEKGRGEAAVIVYGEVVFVENLITGAVILNLTGRFRGVRPKKWRLAAGAVMCGAYAFILFVSVHWLAALASKMLFSAVVVTTVFGQSTWRGTVKTAGVFYIVSFLMGGVTIAIMYMLKIPGMTGNGSFMLKGTTFLQIAAGVTVTWYLGSWLAKLLKEKMFIENVIRKVEIHIAGRSWQIQALIDTGNSLKDPITGWPVAVLSKDISEKIRRECDSEQFAKLSAIPYRTVGQPSIMFGLRPDCITVDGQNVTNIILGFGERNFSPWRGTERYDLLLHQRFLEGEDL